MKTAYKTIIKNVWYVIATILILFCCGCSYLWKSKVPSLLTPDKYITREVLKAELNYLVEIARSRSDDLDAQDTAKQALFDLANVFSTTGQFNPTGLMNLIISAGAIGFGMNQRQKLKSTSRHSERSEESKKEDS